MKREEYNSQKVIQKELRNRVAQDSNRLKFHLMAPTGWVNDPNGLFEMGGTHHIYYQYTPFSATWGMKIWGHYSTKDFITYIEEEPFLFPDTAWDKDGVYSGSAFVENNEIHFYYTGNVKYTDSNYDYVLNGREQNTIHVISKDGQTHSGKSLAIGYKDYPSLMSCHVRDPKVYKHKDKYYMVLGARTTEEAGCVLIYVSSDLKSWDYTMQINSTEPLGYMWECPDIFELEGHLFLMICPQGIKNEEFRFQNVYQCGYFPLDLNMDEKTYHLGEFGEFDAGFDLYAAQSYVDEKGRRICIAWMGLPDAPYHNEDTVACGWQHALTLPRQLIRKKDRILQKPLDELKSLRTRCEVIEIDSHCVVKHDLPYFELEWKNKGSKLSLCIKKEINLNFEEGVLVMDITRVGNGRYKRKLCVDSLESLHIYVDTSSIEVFVNDGLYTMTSRYYCKNDSYIEVIGQGEILLHTLSSFQVI